MGRSQTRSRLDPSPSPVETGFPAIGDHAASKTEPWDRDFIRVGRSPIEGTGVFAKRRIHRGARIIEYVGERVPADRLLAADDATARIYTFRLDESMVIDGARGGNASRFINHSCAPNCEAYSFDDRLFIYALTEIPRGQELTFDYKLSPAPGQPAESGPDSHACRCAAPNCRGTMRRAGAAVEAILNPKRNCHG